MAYNPKALGARLRDSRTSARLSQQAVAERAGVAQKTVSRIEAGEQDDPGFCAVVAIAAVLGLPPDTIAAWAGLLDDAGVPTVAERDTPSDTPSDEVLAARGRLVEAMHAMHA